MAGIAGMITEGKNSDFIRIFMVATVEVRIFLALLSPSYEKFVVTLRMATLGQAEMPVHLLKFESWNVKAHA